MKKNGSTKAKAKRAEEYRQENIEHALLRILRADRHDFFAVFNRRLLDAFELDVCLDELDCAIGAGCHRLRGSTREPVNHRAAGDQAKYERSMQNGQFVHVLGETMGQRHDDRENHGGGADDGSADQTGLAVALNVFPAPSFSSSRSFARSKLTSMLKSFLISCFTFGTCSISESS